MDKNTLRSLVIELRKENKTFEEISGILEKAYNVKKSRQTLNGIYRRAMAKIEEQCTDVVTFVIESDIENYRCLGICYEAISQLIFENHGVQLTTNKISDIVKGHTENIGAIEREQINKVKNCIERNESVDVISVMLMYKGVKPTEKMVKRLISKTSSEMLRDEAAKIMVKVLNITDSGEVIKYINRVHNFDISLKEVGQMSNNM